MGEGITLPKELTGDRREMVLGLRSFRSNDADVRRRMLDAAMMIEHLDWSLRNVACLYREAIQLADAHRRRAEAAEARMTEVDRLARANAGGANG